MAAGLEPVALHFPVRVQRADEGPETRRMIADAQVTQLVHDDVAQRVERREGERQIERDPVARVQAAPEALERLDAYAIRRAAEFRRVTREIARHVAAD